MYDPKTAGERRRTERYYLKGEASAFVDSNINLMGKIEDIGIGGLSFRYLQLTVEERKPDNINLILPKQNFSIERIPVKVVSDVEEMNRSCFSTVIMRRCGVSFNTLSDRQISQLNYFLENFTTSD